LVLVSSQFIASNVAAQARHPDGASIWKEIAIASFCCLVSSCAKYKHKQKDFLDIRYWMGNKETDFRCVFQSQDEVTRMNPEDQSPILFVVKPGRFLVLPPIDQARRRL
jgi:hypothetical protein